MTRQQRIANRLGLILGTACAWLLSVALGHASDDGDLTAEFHESYPLSAPGSVSLENIKGAVPITAWAAAK